ncbi:stealth family protein [Legionella feeleii]|uniref:Capsular polysaccharide phosphotransferase SacB n=1 Tax=Legionella feeleii TaxID=453 RepID=A0A378IQU3_9GAMM|nr:stealth family protein [Legionella feeleii]STX36861.1 Capsular polysaccharide phosphotransferase SacB [Legionella feeleii]
MREPIDAVITWVNGQDPYHAEKLANYLAMAGFNRTPTTAAQTRFNESGELDYCVLSLLRFAPWIRTIFIVTDAQTPNIVKNLRNSPFSDRVRLIDHQEIFCGFEDCLPTFNSLSIESVLWRIPGLANNFLYLNDDFFIIRPVNPEDFFHTNNLILRGKWKIQSRKKWPTFLQNRLSQLIPRGGHRARQEITAQLVGWERYYYYLPHLPHPIRKSTLADFFYKNPQLLAHNVQFPLRDNQQFWPISLAQHMEIKHKRVIFDKNLRGITLNAASNSLLKLRYKLAVADETINIAFLCIQSLDIASKKAKKLLIDWLDKRIL